MLVNDLFQVFKNTIKDFLDQFQTQDLDFLKSKLKKSEIKHLEIIIIARTLVKIFILDSIKELAAN